MLEFIGAESYRFRERLQRQARYCQLRVAPFSTINWFPFRLSKCGRITQSGSLSNVNWLTNTRVHKLCENVADEPLKLLPQVTGGQVGVRLD